ncbi:MAG TPA: hypothetical protein PKV21_07725 [bacterium]|nr:hypothetical protein [bacterium]
MDLFIELIKKNKMPIPIKEYKFCHNRRWRFDYAFVEQKIAIEQEGGVWINGRHNRGKGFLNDLEKYNTATIMGWRVLRYPPDLLYTQAIEDLKKLLTCA